MSQQLSIKENLLSLKQEKLKHSAATLCDEDLSEIINNLIKTFRNGQDEVVQTIAQLKVSVSESLSQSTRDSVVRDAVEKLQDLAAYVGDWCAFYGKCNGLPINHGIFKLNNFAIKDIFEILKHCKESSSIYEQCFFDVSSSLSNLFKIAYQTLKAILEMFEKADLEASQEDEIGEFANGIMELFQLSLVLKDIDLMPMVTTLRCLNRTVIAKKDWLHDKLDCLKIFTIICTCITDKLDFCWSLVQQTAAQNQSESKRTSKVIKVLRFLVGMLLQMIKEYKNEIYGDATASVIKVLLSLQWMSPMSLNLHVRGTQSYEEFCSSVLSVVEPLLTELLDERDFILKFRSIASNFEVQAKKKNVLPALLISLSISSLLMKTQDDSKNEWMKEVSLSSSEAASIVELIIILFEKCKNQNLDAISIPSYTEAGKPLRYISLHEYSYVRICSFVSTLNQDQFQKVEFILLKNLLQLKTLSFFVADIISFIARWGPESLCLELAEFFAQLSLSVFNGSSIQSEMFSRCTFVMQRLVLLLGDAKKEEFVKDITVSRDSLPIWSALPIHKMSRNFLEKRLSVFVASTLKGLEEYKISGQVDMILVVIKIWEQWFANNVAFQMLPPVQKGGIIAVLMEVFADFQNSDCEEMDENFVCLLVATVGHIASFLEARQIKKILQVLVELVSINHSDMLFIKLCDFMIGLKSARISHELKDDCLRCTAQIFKSLISHKSFFVRHEAMKSLAEFAEVTIYPEVVIHCVPASMNKSFAAFVKNNFFLADMSEDEKENRLLEALESLQQKREDEIMDVQMIKDDGESVNQNLLKLPKELKILMNDLEKAVNAIKEYSGKRPIPDWTRKKITALMKDINSNDL